MNPEDAKKFSLPAFPQKETLNSDCHGMDLRDYFAAKAMQGLLAHPECGKVGKGYDETTNCVADEAYRMADAMLKAREV